MFNQRVASALFHAGGGAAALGRYAVPALPISADSARLANPLINRDRQSFLDLERPAFEDSVDGTNLAGLQSAVLSSPIALLEHRLALERQRAQQLAHYAHRLENDLAEERERAAEQTRCAQSLMSTKYALHHLTFVS